jgi:hypothetical protein
MPSAARLEDLRANAQAPGSITPHAVLRIVLDEVIFGTQDLRDRCRNWCSVLVFFNGSLVVKHVSQWPYCHIRLAGGFNLSQNQKEISQSEF